MKRKSILVLFVMVIFIAATMPALSDSAEDYKVIKKAVKGNKSWVKTTWFKVEITDKKLKKSKKKVTKKTSFNATLIQIE